MTLNEGKAAREDEVFRNKYTIFMQMLFIKEKYKKYIKSK